MTSTMVALPQSSDAARWTPEEKALVEAAGLVHSDSQSGEKTLAERPVVAAFLQHCQRTGLDPIARQIYSIARKSRGQLKWQIQISIDGARLVAERTGKYEGQTTPEFTADGVTWTQVWLASDPPKAARVGVYRRGFREALYAVALWDAYVQTKDEWVSGRKTGNVIVSDMWSKMGPLMLAKCAEMLALRKAFPQDLSGLYSSEEMQQAEQAAAPAAAPTQQAPEAYPDPEEKPAEPVRDWLAEGRAATSMEQLGAVYAEAQRARQLNLVIDRTEEGKDVFLGEALRALKAQFEKPTPEAAAKPRDFVGEARAATTQEELDVLLQEAAGAGAPREVVSQMAEFRSSLRSSSEEVVEGEVVEDDQPMIYGPGEGAAAWGGDRS